MKALKGAAAMLGFMPSPSIVPEAPVKKQRRKLTPGLRRTARARQNMITRVRCGRAGKVYRYPSRTISYEHWKNCSIEPRWTDKTVGFENFVADMGECPKGFALERKDNALGYCKANCAWIPNAKQAQNRSTTRFITHPRTGVTKCRAEWGRELGATNSRNPGSVIDTRLERGWSLEKALDTQVQQ